jgi:hypothetical protein
MSATNRKQDKRKKNDNYPTPAWATRAILSRLKPTGSILEPCIGEGSIVLADHPFPADDQARRWYGVEIRQETYDCLNVMYNEGKLEGFTIRDFFSVLPMPAPFPEIFDWVITNPPYSMAEEFIKRALEYAPVVVMLLRLNFLEGQKRSEWMSRHVPDVFVLSKRPNFLKGQIDPDTGKPFGGDACAYAWMMFYRHERTSGSIEVLRIEEG